MRILFTILIYPFLLLGCGPNNTCELNEVLNYIRANLYYIPSNEWVITQEAIFPDSSKSYDLYQDQGDTIYYLTINLKCTETIDGDQNKYKIKYIKRYFDSKYVYDIIFEQEDTVIFYKALLEDQSNKEFYLGKYYYMISHPDEFFKLGYSEDDYIYIHDNLDSLKNIRGDSIVLY
jgi:hypothetical protein